MIRTIALAVDTHGGLEVMFANAGISGGMANIFDTDVALITDVLRVNVVGPFLAIRHAAPRIAGRGGGAIVLTASVAGLRSGAGSPAYSASKAGVISLAQVAAQQLSGSNVRVNALLPGLTETGMTAPVYDHARAVGKEDRTGSVASIPCAAVRRRRSWRAPRCSSPRAMPATSTVTRRSSTAACPPATPSPGRITARPRHEPWSSILS